MSRVDSRADARVLFLTGAPAFSDFRIAKLLQALKPQGVKGLEACFRYFVELSGEGGATPLAEDDLAFLCELLHARVHAPKNPPFW